MERENNSDKKEESEKYEKVKGKILTKIQQHFGKIEETINSSFTQKQLQPIFITL